MASTLRSLWYFIYSIKALGESISLMNRIRFQTVFFEIIIGEAYN